MDKDMCLKLISLYGGNTWLWNPSDPKYTNKRFRENTWLNIGREMNMPVAELKKKMVSLMGSFRREKSREKKSRLTGSDHADVYKSAWFAYNAFAFMSDRNEAGTTQDTMEHVSVSTSEEAPIKPRPKKRKNIEVEVVEEEIKSEINDNPEETNKTYGDSDSNDSYPSEPVIIYDEDPLVPKSMYQQVTEYDAVGINVSKKLAKMDTNQAILAESIINNVLRRGLLDKLTDDTDLCDIGCGRVKYTLDNRILIKKT